jgi:hypothetical protein
MKILLDLTKQIILYVSARKGGHGILVHRSVSGTVPAFPILMKIIILHFLINVIVILTIFGTVISIYVHWIVQV